MTKKEYIELKTRTFAGGCFTMDLKECSFCETPCSSWELTSLYFGKVMCDKCFVGDKPTFDEQFK